MRLAGRERTFIRIGVALLGVILLFHLAIFPAYKRTRELDRLIAQKEKDLREVRSLRKDLEALRELRAALVQKVPAQERNLAPLAKLDGLIGRSDIRQNIRSIKPSPGSPGGTEGLNVEILMEKIDIPQLTRFLFEAQSAGGFRITRMAVKPRYTTPRYLDLNLQMVFYQS
jgi:hypothetical protein